MWTLASGLLNLYLLFGVNNVQKRFWKSNSDEKLEDLGPSRKFAPLNGFDGAAYGTPPTNPNRDKKRSSLVLRRERGSLHGPDPVQELENSPLQPQARDESDSGSDQESRSHISTESPSENAKPEKSVMDKIWDRLSPEHSSSEDVDKASMGPELRDWSKYIIKGEFIGSGGYGDMFAVEWRNIPYLDVIPPDAVVTIIQDRTVKKDMGKKRDEKPNKVNGRS